MGSGCSRVSPTENKVVVVSVWPKPDTLPELSDGDYGIPSLLERESLVSQSNQGLLSACITGSCRAG